MEKNLTTKQVAAIGLFLQGKSCQQIADELKITKQTIVNWRKKEEFQKELRKQQEDLLQELSCIALTVISDLMVNAQSENVRLNAAKDVLSRCGFDATQKIENSFDSNAEIIINIED